MFRNQKDLLRTAFGGSDKNEPFSFQMSEHTYAHTTKENKKTNRVRFESQDKQTKKNSK